MGDSLDNSKVLDYFESEMKDFIVKRLSRVENWWNVCIPPEIRKDASQRHERAKKINDILNKPNYDVIEYLNFDGYERIISRRDNWKEHFEDIFLDSKIFSYKMHVILSLRNDIRHGRKLDEINSARLRIQCYDILSQIYEKMSPDNYDRKTLAQEFGFKLS